MGKHRFFNMYLTSAISIAMVLFLVGLLGTMLLSAHSLMQHIKENMAMTITLKPQAQVGTTDVLHEYLNNAPFTKSVRYISQQQALKEHIQALGEDPTKYLGYNPLRASFELYPLATYASVDSMEVIENLVRQHPCVEDVMFQRDIVKEVNTDLSTAYIGIVAVAIVLLFIALALIMNTIRLQIYSKRFIIHTMSLVGATAWTIRRPFVRRNVISGILAGLVALGVLALIVYYVHRRLGVIIFPLTMTNILSIVVLVIGSGIIITLGASFLATNHYLRMKADNMYRI